MPTLKSKFNWSALNRETIVSFLFELYPKLVKKDLSILRFHKILSTQLKKLAPLKIKRNTNFKIKSNQIWVGGTYYSDYDQEKQKSIEIVLEYCLFDEQIYITPTKFKTMCYTIADTVLHELIHMRQYRRRNFKVLPDYASNAEKQEKRLEQSYLGCSDEIDAYSFNIACELLDKFNGNTKKIVNYLNEDQKRKNRKHNSWRMYLKAFNHDHSHPIIRRVKKKVIRYIPHAIIGKPYRNKEWIDR